MKTKALTLGVVLGAAALFSAGQAMARDTIQIAGSSTVLPFASIVAEEFGAAFPDYPTPVVGSGGSSGGLRQFCEGAGENTIDIANASRRIRAKEVKACNESGVKDIYEIRIGYDGIVFATNADQGDFALKPIQIYKAIASKVPQDGKMVDNPYTKWSDIDSALPDQEINLVIPASNHGTREVFEEKVILPGCEAAGLPEMGEDEMEAACLSFRQERVVEISGDYTETLARLQANPSSVGVFGLSFYDQNRDTLKVATIDGITPSLETIASGDYPVSRPLFFYVKGEHLDAVPGIADYVAFFLSDQMAGSGGRLEEAGLIPAPEEEREKVLKNFEDGVAISASDVQG
ncbi:PstS family phosphate ABC transporter substrate-binding protein [Kaustia mangrovi]|uniref:PstS family phosphate ABC transporter substrate-binding protein n=1 Tax=Kaustia mangrovi TaxID=2593653 RepID=UPI001BD0A777|nr:substrate-binding domain-containing protein [Kaustia mangrovi]